LNRLRASNESVIFFIILNSNKGGAPQRRWM
jgi:hypothetical protein